MKTPILFITFNRPNHTRKVLEAIMQQNPDVLYVFQDSPRANVSSDSKKCDEVRCVIEGLTAGTRVHLHTLFPEKNLGCGPGPMTALNWFFSENEYGIVLEDDAVPHPDFFPYCEELLLKYKDDVDVRAIGSMHLDTKTFGDGSYYFSMMNRTFCAWATWARAWKDFDLYHRDVSRSQLNRCLKEYGCGLRMREYWCDRLAEVQKDAFHNSSWDQQFWMSIWLHHGKGIMPNVNLSTNIGFGAEATHTFSSRSVGSNRKSIPIMPLKHPSSTRIQSKADWRFQALYFDPCQYGWKGLKYFPFRLNKRIKRLVGHEGPWFGKKENG